MKGTRCVVMVGVLLTLIACRHDSQDSEPKTKADNNKLFNMLCDAPRGISGCWRYDQCYLQTQDLPNNATRWFRKYVSFRDDSAGEAAVMETTINYTDSNCTEGNEHQIVSVTGVDESNEGPRMVYRKDGHIDAESGGEADVLVYRLPDLLVEKSFHVAYQIVDGRLCFVANNGPRISTLYGYPIPFGQTDRAMTFTNVDYEHCLVRVERLQ